MEQQGEVPEEAMLQDTQLRERVEQWGNDFMDKPMNRRTLLGLAAVTAAQGLLALRRGPRGEERSLMTASNTRIDSHEHAGPASTTPNSTTTTTTTTPPPPPPPPPPEHQPEGHVEAAEVDPDSWTPEQKMARIISMIGFIPGLQDLSAQKPEVPFFQDIPGKMAHLERLRLETDVGVDEYHHTVVNETLVGAFRGHPDYGTRIQPRLTVVHWTVDFPNGDMNRLINGMIGRRVNYHGVADQIINGQTQMYRFFDEDFPRQGAHAHRANQLGRGYAMVGARLEDLHPLQFKEIIKAIVRDHRKDNLPIDHTTVVSHFAVDLILDNPTFNPATRLAATYGKFDIPQEAINIIVEKAQALDAALGPR